MVGTSWKLSEKLAGFAWIMPDCPRSSINDKLRGLDGGAVDYLVKPFEFPELLARIRSLQRRGDELLEKSTLIVADLELDSLRHRVCRGATRIDLTTKELLSCTY